MNKLVLNPEFNLYERNGRVFCSSRQVSGEFGKEHYNVLRDIDDMDCSVEFTALNFEVSKYKDGSGKWNKEYLMTKDGFVFLVMGYRGKKAARFKEAYIRRFNEMEQYIKNRIAAQLEYPELTDSIKLAHDPAKFYHYRNEADLINRIVLGMTAKQFRMAHGLPKDASIRDYLTLQQIEVIQRLQKLDAVLVVVMPDFQQRKETLKTYFRKMLQAKELTTGTG